MRVRGTGQLVLTLERLGTRLRCPRSASFDVQEQRQHDAGCNDAHHDYDACNGAAVKSRMTGRCCRQLLVRNFSRRCAICLNVIPVSMPTSEALGPMSAVELVPPMSPIEPPFPPIAFPPLAVPLPVTFPPFPAVALPPSALKSTTSCPLCPRSCVWTAAKSDNRCSAEEIRDSGGERENMSCRRGREIWRWALAVVVIADNTSFT